MSSEEVLAEEFEVLESIYPDELTKVSERELQIIVEPEEPVSGVGELKLLFTVKFPPEYPDVYPDVSLEPAPDAEGDEELTSEEQSELLNELNVIGNENLGMAMTFTLISHLRERLSSVLGARLEKVRKEEAEKERKAIEEEEMKTRGTPVTHASFLSWRAAFLKELSEKKAKEDEEKLKAMTPKEREEWRRAAVRLTGRQLFEGGGDRTLEDASLVEEGTESVDISQFDREERHQEVADESGVHLSDSD